MNEDERNEIGFTPAENLKRLKSGVVLAARDVLQDPNFDATLVLVCNHSELGAYGLVLNRLSHMPLSEIFDGLNKLNLKREVYIGGPVQQLDLQIIQITETPVEEAVLIAPGVYLGGKWESSFHMIESDPESTRLFLGYSGWSPGQLESEIEVGAWDVYTVDLKKLLFGASRNTFSNNQQLSEYLKTLL
ncbi:MAG TPA: YqgE/AlgH family protein [Chitinispirillaceae bacterium]|nr:YqgE/AlgH family protein [Chitinispirillaceae bacterium]